MTTELLYLKFLKEEGVKSTVIIKAEWESSFHTWQRGVSTPAGLIVKSLATHFAFRDTENYKLNKILRSEWSIWIVWCYYFLQIGWSLESEDIIVQKKNFKNLWFNRQPFKRIQDRSHLIPFINTYQNSNSLILDKLKTSQNYLNSLGPNTMTSVLSVLRRRKFEVIQDFMSSRKVCSITNCSISSGFMDKCSQVFSV